MPIFEYVCGACEQRFEKIGRPDETPPCPTCGATDTKKLLSGFSMRSSCDGGQLTSRPQAGCTSCGHAGPAGCRLQET